MAPKSRAFYNYAYASPLVTCDNDMYDPTIEDSYGSMAE